MEPKQLKDVALLKVLKENKQVQQSALRLRKTEDWKVLRLFVAKVKQVFLEATLSVENIEDLKRYKNVISGMESIVNLPEFVDDLKKIEKEDKISKEEEEKEARRRKYNPGAFMRKVLKRGGDKNE
jgi:hypothetical protein